MSYNKVIMVGRFVRNLELKVTNSGTSVITTAIAVKKPYGSNSDNDTSYFFDVTFWGNKAEFVDKYFSKGDEILIEGYLQSRSYEDRDGKKRTVYEIIAEKTEFVGSKSKKYETNKNISYDENDIKKPDNNFDILDDDGDLPF